MESMLSIGEYMILLCFCNLPKLKNFLALWNFVNTCYTGLEISKCYSSYNFHSMTTKRYEGIRHHGGIQAITFLSNRRSFKYFVTLWNFNMDVNGKILRSQYHDNGWPWRETGQNLGLALLCTVYVRYFLCLIRWVQFGVIQCTLQVSDILFKTLLLPRFSSDFNQIMWKLL